MTHASLAFGEPSTPRKYGALVGVLGIHAVLGVALVTGTAHRLVQTVIQPVKVALLDEPQQPPPPPPQALPEPPPMELPRPVFVPPPEIRVARPPPPAPIRATTVAPPPAPPRPVVVPKTPSPAPAPPPVAVARDLSQPAKIVVSDCDRPTYPAAARRSEATGTSRIRFEVDKNGRVVNAEVVHRSGHSRAHRQLDKAALEALSQCLFTPGRDKQGRATGGYASVDYVWQLE